MIDAHQPQPEEMGAPTPEESARVPKYILSLDAAGTVLAMSCPGEQLDACPLASRLRPGVRCQDALESALNGDAVLARRLVDGLSAVLAGRWPVCSVDFPLALAQNRHWLSLRALLLPEAEGARAVVTVEDITPRRRQWDDLTRRLAEQERRIQEVDQLAAIASHDLKAPLRGIANLARWIEEDLGTVSDDVSEHLRLLRGRVGRMEAMVDGLLQYARLGRTQVNQEPVDVGDLLHNLVDLIDAPPAFQVLIVPGMPVVPAPRVRLEQVFLNLIVNAIKHHHRPDGVVEVLAREDDDGWEFLVRDDGPGIDPRYHERVFQVFQTLEARDRVENTGIGLALVKRIVEDQGGAVRLESHEGAGATFRFTWPKRSPEAGMGKETPQHGYD